MQLTIDKNEFLKALALPVTAASHKTAIPILGNVLLDATTSLRVSWHPVGMKHGTSTATLILAASGGPAGFSRDRLVMTFLKRFETF